MTSKELREQRAKLITDARADLDLAEKDGREWTSEDEATFDERMADADNLRKQYERIENLEAAEKDVAAARGVSDPDDLGEHFEGGEKAVDVGSTSTSESRAAFSRWCGASKEEAPIRAVEYRALQSDIDTQAGYLVADEQFVAELIKDFDDTVFIRDWSRKFTVRTARSLGAPKRTAAMSTFAWSGEIVAPTADTALAYGKRELSPHYMTGSILVSRDLLRSAMMPAENMVRQEFAINGGEVQEDAFLTGNGSQQPLGIFTASADGISTTRDFSTGNSTTEVKFDGLIEAKWQLKAGYWPGARWLFHRDIARQIAKEKDGEGNYLWRENVRVGEPDVLLGLPTFISERAPSTATAGLYVGMLGNFQRGYWIADALDMELQRLDELNARTNQVEFIGRLKTDGMPVLEEAFSRVTLAP